MILPATPEPPHPNPLPCWGEGARLAQPQSNVRPLTILIAALGGEGGGVLTDWIVAAAESQNFPVQSTSIPGVAQRTGATTYHIELVPSRRAAASPTSAGRSWRWRRASATSISSSPAN